MIIGTDIPADSDDGAFVLEEFLKYSDDRMRMNVLRELGLERQDIVDFIQYNDDRHQIEVYSVVKHDVRSKSLGFDFSQSDIILSNVARRPPIDVLRAELEEFFRVMIINHPPTSTSDLHWLFVHGLKIDLHNGTDIHTLYNFDPLRKNEVPGLIRPRIPAPLFLPLGHKGNMDGGQNQIGTSPTLNPFQEHACYRLSSFQSFWHCSLPLQFFRIWLRKSDGRRWQ